MKINKSASDLAHQAAQTFADDKGRLPADEEEFVRWLYEFRELSKNSFTDHD